MSFNRENVVWQSPADGLWRNGFYRVMEHSHYGDDDFDDEWDVDYDYGQFEWTSRAHLTMEDAHSEWSGANPGGCDVAYASDPDSARFDHMWKMHRDADYAEKWTKKNHATFITTKQKAVAESGTLSKLRPGVEVDARTVDKLNPGVEVMGYSGPLRAEGDWLVLSAPRDKTIKVYNPSTGKLYRHGWKATTTVTVIERSPRRLATRW